MLVDNNVFITLDDFLTNYHSLLELSHFDELIEFARYEDEFTNGWTHIHYHQYYNGYEVEDASIILHLLDGYVNFINGELVRNINLIPSGMQAMSKRPLIPEKIALQIACEELGIVLPTVEQQLKSQNKFVETNNDEDISVGNEIDNGYIPNLNPEGKLCFMKKAGQRSETENYSLGWRFKLLSEDLTYTYNIVIDAQTGNISEVTDGAQYGKTGKGSVSTLWYGDYVGGINTFKCAFCSEWRLERLNRVITFFNNTEVKDKDNTWIEEGVTRQAASGHWAIENVQKFFEQYYNANCHGGVNDSKIYLSMGYQVTSNYPEGYSSNTVLSRESLIKVGTLSNKPMISIDILGHEYTHSLLYCMGFPYNDINPSWSNPTLAERANEQGAVREAVCDMMGKRAEFYIRNFPDNQTNNRWNIAKDINGVGIRSMDMPKYTHYSQMNTTGSPLEKAFDNMGIGTRWFTILANSINIANAADIAYFAIRDYSASSIDFKSFKNATIKVAQSGLWGWEKCGLVATQVLQAWKDVGVASASERLPGCSSMIDPPIIGPPIVVQPPQRNNRSEKAANSHDDNSRIDKNYHINIYPNPAKEYIALDIKSDLIGSTCSIESLEGKTILNCILNATKNIIDIHAIKSGVFILSIYKGNTKIDTKKIVIL